MIQRDCGAAVSALLGLGKEVFDVALGEIEELLGKELKIGHGLDEAFFDMLANKDGWDCAGFETRCIVGVGWVTRWFRDSCEECCKKKGHES